MLVFNQKFVSGSCKIKSTIEGLAFDRPCWAIMPDLLRTPLKGQLDLDLDAWQEYTCLLPVSMDVFFTDRFLLLIVTTTPPIYRVTTVKFDTF